MQTTNIIHGNYSAYSSYYQIKLPLNLEFSIPANDPVRLLSAFVEGMDLSELYKTYDRIRKNQATPRQMLKIILYAAMNRLYSSRDIESACRRDINYMYLLEGMPAPDHATVARFISLHLSRCSQKTLASMTEKLYEAGEISGKTIFIDGTKIESVANKYTFVWKKRVIKSQEKLTEKVERFVSECEELYGIRAVYNDRIDIGTLKRLRKQLMKVVAEEGVVFVQGVGHRKSILQKSVEELDEYLRRLRDYKEKLETLGERNSYSKTDPDATFMRMKEDAMLNGQLKPAYNIQHGVDSEYITWADISHYATDTNTLVPFLKGMERHLSFKYTEVVADAGYESEENYVFLDRNDQLSFIKPADYEYAKTKRYRNDIGRRENMRYEAARDIYICKSGKELRFTGYRNIKTAGGYVRHTNIYTCNDCTGCQYKSQCIHGNNSKIPMDERNKVLRFSKTMDEMRQKNLERFSSDYGIRLRINRSIQAEGSFADVKEDMNFRRYMYRGKKNALAQSIVLAMARNIYKLHCRIQTGRTGLHLFQVNSA